MAQTGPALPWGWLVTRPRIRALHGTREGGGRAPAGGPRLEVLASGDSGFDKTDGTATHIPTEAGQGHERASRAARVGGLQLAAGAGGMDVGGSTRLPTPGRGACRAPAPRWVAARGVV